MNWFALFQLIMELIKRLQQQDQTLAVDWQKLFKYLPEILDLVFRIIKDVNPSVAVTSRPLTDAEIQALDWEAIMSAVIQLLKAIGILR